MAHPLPHVPPPPHVLEAVFRAKYGDPQSTGWSPQRRHRYGYYLPADVYEAVVEQAVRPGCRWIDVGGGHNVFPENPELARELVARSSWCVAVDPDMTAHKNEIVHERVQLPIEQYRSDVPFDLATLRMVAEHIVNPEAAVDSLRRLVKVGGLVIVFTVNKWSPITVLSGFSPFWLHHPVKRLLWGGEEEDTFPVAYRMNTRERLRQLFSAGGFEEVRFAYLDDLSVLGRFKLLNACELFAWRICRRLGMRYPENCLLGIYQRRASS